MKSNVKKKIEEKDDKITLSIGMIVKNEEKHLENCLSALKKLMDNVSCELIIVDTGSTDRTKEIALKYTDKVYDFEWINDFAAARNYGLEKAVGEWFMYVDADEYLDEDCEEMINFFNMPEVRNKYWSASISRLEYGSNNKGSMLTLIGRISRMYDGIKFDNPIHEVIPMPLPHGYFSTVFHHYGYVYNSLKEKRQKGARNTPPLLKAYEEDPTDLRTLSHLCDAIMVDENFEKFELREPYFKEYLKYAKEKPTHPYTPGAFIKNMVFYLNSKRYMKAIEISKEFFELEYAERTIAALSVYFIQALSYANLDDYENSYESAKKYFEYYEKYKSNKLEMIELRFCNIYGLIEQDYNDTILRTSKALYHLNRYEESLEYLEKLDISKMSIINLKAYLSIVRDLVNRTSNHSFIVSCYKKILELNDEDKTGFILFLMDQYYMEHPSERENFVNVMLESGVEGKYIDLMKIVKADNDGEDVSTAISDFVNSVTNWKDGYNEAIYLAMKHNVDLTDIISRMPHNLLIDTLTIISDGHYDCYADIALNYCQSIEMDSIQKMFWCICALEAAVHKSNELDHDRKYDLYDFFVCILSDYVYNIYNPDLLNPQDVDILPELHRFGYYMTLAFSAKNDGDDIGYIRCLKEALRLCEPMKDLVSFYLSEFEEELKTR